MGGLPWGGSEELWFQTAVFALNEGVKVSIYIKKWSSEHEKIIHLRDLGAQVNYFEATYSSTKDTFVQRILGQKVRSASQAFLSQVELSNPDVIIVNQGDTFSAFNSPVFAQLIKLNIPVCLISQHLSDSGFPDAQLRIKANRYIDKISKFCFVSQRSLELTKRYLNTDGTNFHLVNNPVNLDRKEIVKFPDLTVPSFAVVARLDCHFKGQDILLEVLSQDKWKSREWSCNFYGKGIDKDYLHLLIDKYGLNEKVQLKGHLESVEEIWKDNHLLILPSISEGTPLSLVEANICGRAAVVTDVGGNTEVVQENQNGWIAEAPLKVYIDKALERAWENKNRWEEMGQTAHKRALERYEMNAGQQLFDLIAEY